MAVGVPGPVAPYLRPDRLEDALAILASEPRLILAGGTDVYPASASRPLDRPVLDITALPGLRRVVDDGDAWLIPALTTWTDVAEASLPPAFDGLRMAARTIGGRQIQNAGTICGNVVNASPASDGMPNLLALGASVELASTAGARVVPLDRFVLGNRKTDLRPGELIVGLRVPKLDGDVRSTFEKLGSRAYLVISIVAVAAVIRVEDGRVVDARVAVGACSPVARRLAALEADLVGRPANGTLVDVVRRGHLAGLAPIDDVRGTAAYRSDAVRTLVRRALAEVVG
ncbi:MAG TPA: FAD binding domain-containing protein [Candidatus Limnocylindrales bacterium]